MDDIEWRYRKISEEPGIAERLAYFTADKFDNVRYFLSGRARPVATSDVMLVPFKIERDLEEDGEVEEDSGLEEVTYLLGDHASVEGNPLEAVTLVYDQDGELKHRYR